MGFPEYIEQFEQYVGLVHDIAHGDSNTVVQTENGPLRSFAKCRPINSH